MADPSELIAEWERVRHIRDEAMYVAGNRLATALSTAQGEVEALVDIATERRRQIEVEGWSLEHDDQHDLGEIAEAASEWASRGQRPVVWSWAKDKEKHPRRRQLVIAGALIVAEIERLDRLPTPPQGGDGT